MSSTLSEIQELTITRPDDLHLHLRDGDLMRSVLPYTVAQFARAIIMPNLKPPVVDLSAARAYHDDIVQALPQGADFKPLMTLYLTDQTTPEQIREAVDSGIVFGAKLYPAGATTNSASGVTDLAKISSVLEEMERLDLPLLVHAEVTDPEVDVFDRERVFIDRHLAGLVERYPGLRVVLEHVTTRAGVEFVQSHAPERVAASVTVQHLALNRNALFQGGLRPHHYCLPVLKRESDRQAILGAVVSGDPHFFAGTDSAPHDRLAKENDCGCAGVFSAPTALESYATTLDQAGALFRLEAFASFFGADFYRLPRNTGQVTLRRQPCQVPARLPFGSGEIVPYAGGTALAWTLVQGSSS